MARASVVGHLYCCFVYRDTVGHVHDPDCVASPPLPTADAQSGAGVARSEGGGMAPPQAAPTSLATHDNWLDGQHGR